MLELRGGSTDIAVQVVANGSSFESFLTFRDALIRSPALLSSYNKMKQARAGMDPESYRDRKSSFIEGVPEGRQRFGGKRDARSASASASGNTGSEGGE